MVTAIGQIVGPCLWQSPWEKISGMLESSQERLLRIGLVLTEWYSLPLLLEILDDVNDRMIGKIMGRNSHKALLGILGLLEEHLRKRIQFPSKVG